MFYQVFASIVAVLVLVGAVWQPIQTRRVRDGWKPARFNGTHAEFAAKYGRQFRISPWLFMLIGVLSAAGGLDSHRSDRWWRVLAGVSFLILGGVMLWCRHILNSSPTTPPATSEEEAA
jgi:Short repeat of unknown function (DUF308)